MSHQVVVKPHVDVDNPLFSWYLTLIQIPASASDSVIYHGDMDALLGFFMMVII